MIQHMDDCCSEWCVDIGETSWHDVVRNVSIYKAIYPHKNKEISPQPIIQNLRPPHLHTRQFLIE